MLGWGVGGGRRNSNPEPLTVGWHSNGGRKCLVNKSNKRKNREREVNR